MSRRTSNGRSPLIRKQCQITSFFSPGNTPSPNPSPSISSNTSSLPDKPKQKKPLVVTPPSVDKKAKCSSEVVGKRIRVFWPLDKAWYEGHIRSFDEVSGKHAIHYVDGEEEFLDLDKEEIEWAEDERPRNLRRLRRMSGSSQEAASDDDEWGGGLRGDHLEDDSEDVELENEDDMGDDVATRSRRGGGSSSSKICSRPGKWRKIVAEKMDCVRAVRFDDKEDSVECKTPVDARTANFTDHTNSSGSKYCGGIIQPCIGTRS